MLRNMLLKTVRDQRRAMMWWAIGLVAYGGMMMLFYPSIRDMEGIEDYVDAFPEDLMALFAGDITDFSTPEGYLSAEVFFLFAPLLFVIFAVIAGSDAIAGEEDRGTLELLLSNPVARWEVVLHKFAAMLVTLLGLAALFWVVLAVGKAAVSMEIGVGGLAAVTASAALLGLAFGSLALAIGSATGNRGLSVGVAGAAGIATYLANAMSEVVDVLEPIRLLSPFYYYIGADPLVNGLNPAHTAVLVALSAALLATAALTFERRDIAA